MSQTTENLYPSYLLLESWLFGIYSINNGIGIFEKKLRSLCRCDIERHYSQNCLYYRPYKQDVQTSSYISLPALLIDITDITDFLFHTFSKYELTKPMLVAFYYMDQYSCKAELRVQCG